MNIKDPYHFEEFIKKGYSLDQIYLLWLIKNNIEFNDLLDNLKVLTLYNSLIRKGLILEDGSKLTLTGEDLLIYLESEEKKLQKRRPKTEDFDLWWENYPGTDKFTYNNKKFDGSRALKTNKADCLLKFKKILLEGDYTAEQLISALKLDVSMKKEASIKQGNNKLTYMQNSLTYLNQRSFEPFIELINQGEEQHISPSKGTEI